MKDSQYTRESKLLTWLALLVTLLGALTILLNHI